MGVARKLCVILIILALISLGCLSTPKVDKEKAGYIAGIRFLETHPGDVASYTVSDTGGDAYVVYFNITYPNGTQRDFAEYFVDKYTRDVYAGNHYAIKLAIEQSPNIKRIYDRYPHTEGEPLLITAKTPDGRSYIWELRLIANGVEVAVFRFDAVEERLLGEQINVKTLNLQTG